MLKITHITSVHPVNDNRIRYKECKTLSAMGYDVTLVGAHGKPSTDDDGVKVIVANKPRNRFMRMLVTTARVCQIAAKQKADIYHFHDPELLPYAQLLRLLGKKVVYDMHENLPKSILDKPWVTKSLRKPISLSMHLIERLLLWRVPVVFAEASYPEDYKGTKRKAIVQNFPDLSALIPVSVDKNTVFSMGYIGSISDVRGGSVMLAAYNKLRSEGFDLEFHVVGKGSLGSKNNDKIPEGVIMYGFRPAAEGFRIMAKCHVGLAVLMPIPNYIRSFPTKMFEYMALGLPIIVSDFPLYRQTIAESDCGILVNPNDSMQLTVALRQLIQSPDYAHEMGLRGRELVKKYYSWDNEVKKLIELYRVVMES